MAPILAQLLDTHAQLQLCFIGLIDRPPSLNRFSSDRVQTTPFLLWQTLPAELARHHIHIAPVEATRFNQAKSENKWTEAALVQRPLVASRSLTVPAEAENLILHAGVPDDRGGKVTVKLQVNGKLRGHLDVPASASKDQIEAMALANDDVQKFVNGQKPKKVVVVPGRLVNIVV
mgnify:CR=1 FL=1